MITLKPLESIDELPIVDEVIKVSQSLAILDAILMPEWEFRYFSFNKSWDSNQYMASLRDGEGSHYYILFEISDELIGCTGKVYCKDSKISNDNHFSKIKELNDFEYFLGEVAFENDKSSLYFYFNHSDNKWEIATQIQGIPFLRVFKDKEEAYLPWAEQYYERNIHQNTVKQIFDFKPLNEIMLSELNPDLTFQDILEDIEEIGYPYEK